MAKMKFTSEAAQRRIDKIQEMLRLSNLTINEISERIYLAPRWTREYINYLHEEGYIYISSYRRQTRNTYERYVALYCWGISSDAKRPAALTQVERNRKQYAVLIKNPEAHELVLKKRRAARIKPQRDWSAFWVPIKS
jgi:DNA-binding Lrp family transcriptional regulator